MAFVTVSDPRDAHAWSGIPHFMADGFRRHGVDVEFIGALPMRAARYFHVKERAYARIGSRQHLLDREPAVLRGYAKEVQARTGDSFDVIFSPGTVPLAYLSGDVPRVFWTDATFAGMAGYYPEFSSLSRSTIRNGHRMEQAALRSAALCVYSSDWAAHTAVAEYQARPDRIAVVPFGANLGSPPSRAEAEEIVERRDRSRCDLLFIGRDWARKGGAMAVAVARELHERSIPVRLTTVGSSPDDPSLSPPYVRHLGPVDKTSGDGIQKLTKLLREATFLILPSVAECTPIVLSEANAFGVPCLAIDTGGVGDVLEAGRNGWLFAPEDRAEAWADVITRLMASEDGYRAVCRTSRETYDRDLNWDTATRRVLDLCERAIA